MKSELTTERLLIRGFQPGDWEGLYPYLSDPVVVKYEPYAPMSLDEVKRAALDFSKSSSFHAVCLRETEQLIGQVYLSEGEQQNWELGYVFHRAYWGKGYAAEAAKALLDELFTLEEAHRVFSMCNPENTSSWRLSERLGMRREAKLRQNVYFKTREDGSPLWQDTYIYAILKEDWTAK